MFLTLLHLSVARAGCEALDPYLVALDAGHGCATVTLHTLEEAARLNGLEACLAEELSFRGLPTPSGVTPRLPPPLPGAKATRDPYGLYHALESENFVVRWGDGIEESAAQEMLDAFETAWDKEIVQQGYPLPRYADVYKINVYVAESAPEAPQLYGAPAYQTNDPEGVPMIVMSEGLVGTDGGRITAAHEFFHAVQDAISTYSYTGSGAWYYEATAQWIEQVVYPGDQDWLSAVFGFAFIPHMSLDFFSYATSTEWDLENYHQYGAALWPVYISRDVADELFIRDTWTEAGRSNDPLEVTGILLAERYGLDVNEVFFDFAARNAVWEYNEQSALIAALEDKEGDYINQRISRTVIGQTDGMTPGNTAVTPERFGTNYVEIIELDGDNLHLVFEGTGAGSQGSTPRWNVDFAFARGIRGAYTRVELTDDRTADVWLEGLADPDTEPLYMIVSVVSDERVPRETFSYQFSLETDAVVVDDGDDEPDAVTDLGGQDFDDGRCATGPGPAGAGLALIALALARTRRASKAHEA